jgi:small subunit ribosomal protein S1
MTEEMKTTPASIEALEPGMELRGTVKRIELYGAFVDIGVGQDGLLHISQLGKPNVRNVEDVVKAGEEITVYVLKVEKDTGRIALSLSRPPAKTWDDLKEGDVVAGTVVRLENFGVFVDIGAERPGMIHVSELASGFVNSPSDVVKVGDQVNARIIKINRKKKRIDLSLKAMEERETRVEVVEEQEEEDMPTAMELEIRKWMEQTNSGDGRGGKRKNKNRDNRRDRRDRENELEEIFSRTLRGRQN